MRLIISFLAIAVMGPGSLDRLQFRRVEECTNSSRGPGGCASAAGDG